MQVESVITRSVVTAEPTTSVGSAARLLRDGHFRHLPVVDGGRLVGIASDRDLRADGSESVRQVMHRHVITVTADTPVEVAATIMTENKIGALPVVNPATAELVGIISQTDLFVVLARLLHGTGPSTRLELRLTDLPRELALAASLADEEDIPITSIVTGRSHPLRTPARQSFCAWAPLIHAHTSTPSVGRALQSTAPCVDPLPRKE